ncbi:hypothetical protein [Methylobacterium sp. V23]|uniref:hypothetical protein n=1 Tax=Methylobacterium sp. V23 TaxID=2044878 RepID=UPI000CDB27E3|nr:hypothetical protein [Methylobacterium sp. V23]POR42188.1 hypothetical protein CRT23_15045 [Methylobacterium sp. V23]
MDWVGLKVLTRLEFEGDYWRPLLPENFTRWLDRGARSDQLLSSRTWEDYPLHDFEPSAKSPLPPGCRPSGHDLREALEVAQAYADENIIVIDDVVHKRAPLPVWQVEDLTRTGLYTTRLSLVIPGFEEYWPYRPSYPGADTTWRPDPPAGWLAATDFDIALEASAALYGPAPLHEPQNRSWTRGGLIRPKRDDDRVTVHRPLLGTDLVEARFSLRLCEKVREGLALLPRWEIGPRLERAAKALEAAEERLWLAEGHESRWALDDVAHAMERLHDHARQNMRSTDIDLGPLRAAMLIREARAIWEHPTGTKAMRFG